MFTKQAVGAFLAGGVLVGGVAFAGVAHGASTAVTTAATSTGQSDAQYTAKHAWAQIVPTGPSDPITTLSIPSGQRLTITEAMGSATGVTGVGCGITGTLNGNTVSYHEVNDENGFFGYQTSPVFQPMYVDSGTVSCGDYSTTSTFTLVGYLTPISAG